MPLGASLPLSEQLLLQTRNELRILAMRRDDHTQALGEFQCLIHLAIVDAEEVLIRQKYLERRGAVGDNRPQLRFRLVDKLRDRHMKGIIAGALPFSLRLPELITFQGIVV